MLLIFVKNAKKIMECALGVPRNVPKIRKDLNLFTVVNIQNGKSGFVTRNAF